ncbi:hypothetical protein LguiB_021535 [Lonicera macranthoides]
MAALLYTLLVSFLINTIFPLIQSRIVSELPPSKLSLDYYAKTCPDFQNIIQKVLIDKQESNPTTAAGTLRMFFHDCMVGGCDASILISSNAFNIAERDDPLDQSLPGDAYDAIARVKTVLELTCPGIVSCADILAVAARDLIKIVGGPFYNIALGRKDSLVSRASDVAGHIAMPNMTLTQIISMFADKGYNVQEMVVLMGAHTIGFTHCSEFSNRIFNFSPTSQVDPAMNPKYAEGLRKLCANYKKEIGMSAFNDPMTPSKFDNMYYRNLQRGLGLLASDQAMATDPRTKPFVDLYAADQNAFFSAFARAMEKTSIYKVKNENDGEVRNRCDTFNNLNT